MPENQEKQEVAAEPALPKSVEVVDMLALENANLRRENMELRLQIAQKEVEMASVALRDRYKIGPGDQIDPKTLEILRK